MNLAEGIREIDKNINWIRENRADSNYYAKRVVMLDQLILDFASFEYKVEGLSLLHNNLWIISIKPIKNQTRRDTLMMIDLLLDKRYEYIKFKRNGWINISWVYHE